MSDPKQIRALFVVWLVSGTLLTAPAWLRLGHQFLLLGLLGPFGLLVYKPGESLGGKLLVAIILALPAVLALACLGSRLKRLDLRGRLLWTFAASLLWHLPGVALWLVISETMN